MIKSIWDSTPVVRAFIPYLAGILLAIHSGLDNPKLIILLPLALLLCLVLLRFKKIAYSYRYAFISGLLISTMFFALGLMMTYINTPINKENHFSQFDQNFKWATVRIYEPPQEKEKTIKLQVKVYSLTDSNHTISVSGKAICYLEKTKKALLLKYNDELIIPFVFNDIKPPGNPDEFNYKRYLSFHGIYQQAYISSGQWFKIKHHTSKWFYTFTDRLRIHFNATLKRYLGQGREYKVAAALLLGERGLLDKDLIRAYSGAGAMHVLAVSGLHIGLVYGLLWIIFNALPFLKRRKYLKAILLLSAIWIYASITGLSASVSRAAIMLSFMIGSKMLNRHSSLFNSIIASAFILTLNNPYSVTEIGFLLSYLAVSGIVIIQPKLYRLVYTRFWLIDKIWMLACVSISAQLSTFPIAILFFHQFPIYFLFSNLIVIPMATLILYTGISLFALSWIPQLSKLIAQFLYFFIHLLNQSIDKINLLPSALLTGLELSKVETIIIFISMLMLTLFILRNQFSMLIGSFLGLLLFITSLSFTHIKQQRQKEFIVYNISKVTAFQFLQGTSSCLIADSTLIANKDKMLFHIKHHWWKRGLKQVKIVASKKMDAGLTECLQNKIYEKGHYFNFQQYKLFVVDDPLPEMNIETPEVMDCILIAKSPPVTIKNLLLFFKPRLIIFDHSNRKYLIDKWIASCKSLKIPYFNAAKKAFVWSFN